MLQAVNIYSIPNTEFKEDIPLGGYALSCYGYLNNSIVNKKIRVPHYDKGFKTNYFTIVNKEDVIEELIVNNIAIPEYAWLQEVSYEDRDDQTIFESLDYLYQCGKNEFPDKVRELNKKYKIAQDKDVEWYLSFWGET